MLDPSLLFDGLIILLLAAAIGFALVLNRRLSVLRESKADLERLVGGLHSAVDKAERNLASLREAAESAGRPLQETVQAAARTRDELDGLIDRAEKAAARIEQGLGRGNTGPRLRPVGAAIGSTPAKAAGASAPQSARAAAAARTGAGTDDANRLSPAHDALIQALKGVR